MLRMPTLLAYQRKDWTRWLSSVYAGAYVTSVANFEISRSQYQARLSFNYWRKGGYTVGSEDYRWSLIKEYLGTPLFTALDVIFISTLQHVRLSVFHS